MGPGGSVVVAALRRVVVVVVGTPVVVLTLMGALVGSVVRRGIMGAAPHLEHTQVNMVSFT